MPSFIFSQRQNVDRLLALILLWNVAAGAFVTLFGLFAIGWLYLLPVSLLVPVVGAFTGEWLERNIAVPRQR